jgi:hypothetical protein
MEHDTVYDWICMAIVLVLGLSLAWICYHATYQL